MSSSFVPPPPSAPSVVASANVDVATATTGLPLFPFVAVFAALIPAAGSVVFDPAGNDSLRTQTNMYESVALLSMRVTVTVPASPTGSVAVGIAPSNHRVRDANATAFCAYSTMTFASHESSTQVIDVPVGHAFGRELRGLAIGNSPPVVHVFGASFPNGAPNAGLVRIYLNLQGSGCSATPLQLTANRA